MIPRYSCPEMAELWSDRTRYATWVRVEVLAAEAQAILGRVPEAALPDIQHAPVPAAERVAELEQERDHEVLSFLAAFCEGIPENSARWVHLGMTSYDLVDTAFGYTLAAATDLLLRAAGGFAGSWRRRRPSTGKRCVSAVRTAYTPNRQHSATSWPASPSPYSAPSSACARPGRRSRWGRSPGRWAPTH